jgi:hypothetical protein
MPFSKRTEPTGTAAPSANSATTRDGSMTKPVGKSTARVGRQILTQAHTCGPGLLDGWGVN